MENRYYYSLKTDGKIATVYIYGDINRYKNTSSQYLSKEIEELKDLEEIKVYINSYGGDLIEGLAIYNILKRHKAKVTTIIDGIAASSASLIFMAGDERIIPTTSILMIHNAWVYVAGNYKDLEKKAEDLKEINTTLENAYKEHVNISAEELLGMLDKETYLTSDIAVEKGFATKAVTVSKEDGIAASSHLSIYNLILKGLNANEEKEKDDEEAIVLNAIKELQNDFEEFKNKNTKEEEKKEEDNPVLNLMSSIFIPKIKGE